MNRFKTRSKVSKKSYISIHVLCVAIDILNCTREVNLAFTFSGHLLLYFGQLVNEELSFLTDYPRLRENKVVNSTLESELCRINTEQAYIIQWNLTLRSPH